MTYYRAPQNKALGSPAIADQPDEKFAYFPAFVKVQGKKVVVLGGGDVAAGKLRLLMRSHADITVIAPELCDDIARMHANGKIRWESSPFVDTMINGAAMVFDATDNPHLTARVEAAAKRRNILLNVVDKTAHCDFIVPAILDRAPVMITISTGACAPALARILRQRLETVFPATLSNIAKIARDARETVATHLSDGLSRQRFWTRFFQKALRADSAEKITQDDLSHELRSFVPQGSSATVPSGQSLRLDVDANNAYDIPHGIARHVETADIIFHNDDIAPDILALARRDATLVDLTAATFDSEETLGKQIQFFTQQGMNVLQLCRT
ncbi:MULTISPECIES: bifunctional precorrin-2 dehydrogenase/sirohydrochlorin ferrochelatase [Thalassospira]|jgi:uroporphyrin-III C-methyltransferase/precorrin-2 dehydrogenase/sirohydrochlorin ferrochelatase|uniref:precorrin-2 dehydrogenase n=1 Tax=Thalassospira profundimaris TaxID=502049 RepID=A0A367VK75_9PROT|nr:MULTISPECIES: bifunctional precorrin-2 dehydrogenase/sirohydrochlorin ferrochelatase [Thalassospira]KZB70763.1 siroheme synthase [Thalassospira sp. MCCC 1A01148]MBR9899543.1 bifunctional precorrin-2 dehydrogenase/sirohydrochlorin ferrochelatase [Rhodospirillales bacterium]RCK25607.1 siroheme synthase [Thalassospira profundimaris]HCK19592.1 bifunctional precorrin-2 dehydrogenase/sirohydrochlorin ferrochelatase [Thalassospira sp.]